MNAQDMSERPICQIVTPVGMLGYGFDYDATVYELASLVPTGVPTAIILDSGSTDSGPEKLALGNMSCPRNAYYRDLKKLMKLVHDFRVPLIFGSAGGDGADEHVKALLDVIEEICALEENKDYCFKTLSVLSSIEKATVLERLKAGRVAGCGVCVPPLTAEDVEQTPRIVAQIGPEPYLDLMEANPDFNIIVGGRTYDPATYVAYAVYQLKLQFPKLSQGQIEERYGGFVHMGKIMECGGLCSSPKSHGAVATIYSSGLFDVRPTAPESRCTPYSIAAHALYENGRPDMLNGPGGSLHLLDCKYDQLSDMRSVRVHGSKFRSSKEDNKPYTFKLEGAKVIGYRSIFMGSFKDHTLIQQLDTLIARIRQYLDQQHAEQIGQFKAHFHTYGQGQSDASGPGEVFVVAEVLANTQELANSVVSKARVGMIHGSYKGQKATSGNLGFGLGGKLDIELGPCAQFSIYHLMELNPGEERLRPAQTRSGVKGSKGLMTAHVQTFGKGPIVRSSPEFRASLTRIRDSLPHSGPAVPSPSSTAQGIPPNAKTLSDLCYVLRSKNAGPFEITLDAIFVSEAAYRYARESGVLLPENVAKAVGVPLEDIIWQGFYEPALSFKVTIPRYKDGKKSAAGGFGENDVHASQKHMGLALIRLPEKSTELSLQSLKNIGTVNRVLVATALGIGGWSILRTVLRARRR